MFENVESWWLFLSVVSVLNIIALSVSAIIFNRRKDIISKKIVKHRTWILWLSTVYVFVCAYRSFLPRIDIERIVLYESLISNVFIGRTVTTFAEIFFMMQCAILLNEAAKGLGSRFSVNVSLTLVPIIIIAEVFSWYAMLTTNYLGSVFEESLWTLSGILIVTCLIVLWPKIAKFHRKYLAMMILFGLGFIVFMVTVDVPMYWARWQQDTSAGVQYLSLAQGIYESWHRYDVSFDMALWKDEIPWMTLYFTVAVWVSISLTHAPNYKSYRKPKKKKKKKKLQ